jgi:hypothetical protein
MHKNCAWWCTCTKQSVTSNILPRGRNNEHRTPNANHLTPNAQRLSPIPYPISPIPYPLSPIPYPLSPIPLSPIPQESRRFHGGGMAGSDRNNVQHVDRNAREIDVPDRVQHLVAHRLVRATGFVQVALVTQN